MTRETRSTNKTAHPGLVDNKCPRRKGENGKTVRELDLEEKQRKADEKAEKARDLKSFEKEQVANLSNAATTPVYPTKTLRGGKLVGATSKPKKTQKCRATSDEEPQEQEGRAEGDKDMGTTVVDRRDIQVGVPRLFSNTRPGPLLEYLTQANPKPIEGLEAVASSSSPNPDDATTSGRKRQRMVPTLWETKVSSGVLMRL